MTLIDKIVAIHTALDAEHLVANTLADFLGPDDERIARLRTLS